MPTELSPAVRALYPFTSRYLPVDDAGNRMHYIDEGRGEPIIFVHGNPTWSFYWRNLVKGLSDKRRCIAIDHLGCGLSDKPLDGPYRLQDRIDHLTRLVDALDLHDITWVVHDWGGPTGLGAALRFPERTKRLVITNTGVFEGPIPLEIKMCRWPVIGPLAVRGLNGFVRVGFLRAVERSMPADVAQGFLAPYGSWSERVAIQRFIEDIPLEADHPTRRLFLALGEQIRTFADRPILIAWGEKDFCFTTFYRDGFIARFPNAEVMSLPDASHWLCEDAPEALLSRIRTFLDAHPIAGRT